MKITIPFPGFYESELADALDTSVTLLAQAIYDGGHVCMDETRIRVDADVAELDDEITDAMDYHAAHVAIAHEYANEFWHQLNADSPVKFNARFDGLRSPREYNFQTDTCFCTIQPTDFERMYHATGKPQLRQVIADRFTPYPGFIPFYSADLADWEAKPLAEYDHHEAGTVLLAYIETILADVTAESVIENLSANGRFYEARDEAINWKMLDESLRMFKK